MCKNVERITHLLVLYFLRDYECGQRYLIHWNLNSPPGLYLCMINKLPQTFWVKTPTCIYSLKVLKV